MRRKIIALEERDTTALACGAGIIASVLACAFVMFFLNGTKSDLIALIAAVYCCFVYVIQKIFPKAAKYFLACSPCVGAIIIVVSNTGHYSAMDQTYFLCLIIAIIHYDVFQVLLSAATVLVTNIAGFIFFPEAYLKIHNVTVWTFVLFIYIMSVVCALIIAGRTHKLFDKERELQIYECKLNHIQALEKKNEEHNKFIHDINHYFLAIGHLAGKGDCENILSILNDLNVKISSQNAIVYTGHPVMNAILGEKVSLAKSNKVSMDIYVEPNILFDNLADGDIIIMLDNLLDNALEAVSKLKEESPYIKVRIYRENQGRICIIKIENPFRTPVQYNKAGRILTNKREETHGYGLKSVNAAAKRYGGFLQCSHEDNIFTSVLILPLDGHKNQA